MEQCLQASMTTHEAVSEQLGSHSFVVSIAENGCLLHGWCLDSDDVSSGQLTSTAFEHEVNGPWGLLLEEVTAVASV